MPVDVLVEGTGMPEGYFRAQWVPKVLRSEAGKCGLFILPL